MSRGIRNCNPGNIRRSRVRYRGEKHPSQDPDFKQFESMAMGYRAMFILLDTYRVRYGLRSIREMISRYAPPTENHTALYIEAVWRTIRRSTSRRCAIWRACCPTSRSTPALDTLWSPSWRQCRVWRMAA